jgi:hypothetical protein
MSTFIKLKQYNNPTTNKKATVVKVVKEGTKELFSVQSKKFITGTMFARGTVANKLTKAFFL